MLHTSRNEVSFLCHGERIQAWHYPAQSTRLTQAGGTPALVMAHGLSMTRDSGLPQYAERFAAAGLHVVVFDYRCFGGSEGTPRELVSAHKQVQDYHAALAFTRGLPGVDTERVALWGTSYSGGVATQCAYEDARVRALVLQVPNLDNAATAVFMALHLTRTAPLRGLWLCAQAVRDTAAALFGTSPVYVRAMGAKGAGAAYENDEAAGHVEAIRGPSWQNRIALRDFTRLPLFRPIKHAKQLPCRVFVVAAERDDLTPVAPALRLAKLLGERAELHRYPVGHFAVYTGELFTEVVAKQTAFLVKELGGPQVLQVA
ncbi:MAG: alpha/beta fold hydrolase [Myxococcales bacterium]